MKYISGIPALGVPCKRPSVGKWNVTKREFLDENIFKLRDSEDSPFKNWGIEENKIVQYHEMCTYNVADHVRAYMDMLYDCEFETLKDLFYECINSSECRKDIFMLTYGKLRNLAQFHEINEFMENEFGNAWISYVQSVNNMAEHIGNRAEAIEQLDKIQNKQTA